MYKIFFNTEFHRWEVYNQMHHVIRAGEPQPAFVSSSLLECEDYVRRCDA